MVGADWLQRPWPSEGDPVRIVFASLKGGVGRSTALCVLAAHFASRGLRVLAIDMDLEAPGLGNMLLSDDTLPEFGLLDYLVENGLSQVSDEFLVDLVAPSWLGGGRGRVDVMPVVGRRSLESPENVLSKIARAYLAIAGSSIGSDSLATQMRTLLSRVASPRKYDAVLIDARSGLHETTASALLGLGAEIFLFGTDQPQTFAAFKLLFSHLGMLPSSGDFRDGLRVVRSRTDLASIDSRGFGEEVNSLVEQYFSRAPTEFRPDLSSMTDTFDVHWDDSLPDEEIETPDLSDEVPILSIRDDSQFRHFDPQNNRSILDEKIYMPAFGEFVEAAAQLVTSAIGGSGT
jgi:MinD-like ATPase involved in chromosome partitioning or flagellar assembly